MDQQDKNGAAAKLDETESSEKSQQFENESTAQEEIKSEAAGEETASAGNEPEAEQEEDPSKILWLVGVRFPRTAKVDTYRGDVGNLKRNAKVVVETDRGAQLGQIVYGPVTEQQVNSELKKVLRPASPKDLEIDAENVEREKDAFKYCQKRIQQQGLSMKLIACEYQISGGRITFFFNAEGRVDFRSLVKDLAYTLRARIEMRQIGVRDESKMVGGIGPCGKELCCHQYLRDFAPVSIKMAKDQGLALNPQKVSGVCGRLMCCLVYEQETYKELRKGMPKIGKRVVTPVGEGKVVALDIIHQKIRVFTSAGIREFTREEVEPLFPSQSGGGARKPPEDQTGEPHRAQENGQAATQTDSRDQGNDDSPSQPRRPRKRRGRRSRRKRRQDKPSGGGNGSGSDT